MMSFMHRFEAGPARAGSYVYHVAMNPPRGRCAVHEDDRVRIYRVKRGERRAFRRWLESTIEYHQRVKGAWPIYYIE